MAKEIGKPPVVSPVEITKVAEHLRDLRRRELEERQLQAIRKRDPVKPARPADPLDHAA